MLLYAITVFLSAFLLFQIQPVIAKMILPWFGGCSAVWSTCMLFFQAALLLGYVYAHWLHERLPPRKQAILHTVLLLASLLVLPVVPDPSWKAPGAENPSLRILGLLAVTVGLPYFLLAATSPLLQAWYARTHAGSIPYRLFALSNLASMLALLSYPVLVEPSLSTRTQAHTWSLAYACFGVLCAVTAWFSSGAFRPAARAEQFPCKPAPPPGRTLRVLWVLLAACASTLLLAMTAYLTQDVAAMPFLWILPLSVYLLSFILCFEAPRLYFRPVFLVLLVPALGLMAWFLSPFSDSLKVVPAILVSAAALFVFCMVCHGELVRTRPHPRYLTTFYLMVSLGGAAGGLFVGLLAPVLFNAYYELPAGLALCALLAAAVLYREHGELLRKHWKGAAGIALACGVGLYMGFLAYSVHDSISGYRVVERSFYGQLRIRDADQDDGMGPRRKLIHGIINHGEQILAEEHRRKPTTYFCPQSGVGCAMESRAANEPRRIGIIGLGCGTLVAYGRPGDVFRIYEINPMVLRLARTEFTYLRDTPAQVEVILGDGRLALEREPDQRFDILVMDAFSGDSVPVHLITTEAFRTYLRHLKPGGILALNISNKYLDLRPVMERAASRFGKIALSLGFIPEDEDTLCFSSRWVLIVDPAARQALSSTTCSGDVLQPYPGFRPWTDDFSNIYGILE